VVREPASRRRRLPGVARFLSASNQALTPVVKGSWRFPPRRTSRGADQLEGHRPALEGVPRRAQHRRLQLRAVDHLQLVNDESEKSHKFRIEGQKDMWKSARPSPIRQGVGLRLGRRLHRGEAKWQVGNLKPGKDLIVIKRFDAILGEQNLRHQRGRQEGGTVEGHRGGPQAPLAQPLLPGSRTFVTTIRWRCRQGRLGRAGHQHVPALVLPAGLRRKTVFLQLLDRVLPFLKKNKEQGKVCPTATSCIRAGTPAPTGLEMQEAMMGGGGARGHPDADARRRPGHRDAHVQEIGGEKGRGSQDKSAKCAAGSSP